MAVERARPTYVLAHYGEDLTIGTARRILGDLIRKCGLSVDAAEILPLEAAMDRLDAANSPSSNPEAPFPLIMKGGGIKGLAYIGAIEELSRRYNFNWFVGTSAGAITAILLGAGYTPRELRTVER